MKSDEENLMVMGEKTEVLGASPEEEAAPETIQPNEPATEITSTEAASIPFEPAPSRTSFTPVASASDENGQGVKPEIESVDSISPDKPVAESCTDTKSTTSAPSLAVAKEPEVDVPHMDIEQLKRRTKRLGPKWEGIVAEIRTHDTALHGLKPIYANVSFELAQTLWYAKRLIQENSAPRGRNGRWSQFLREVASDTLRKSADRLISGYTLYLEAGPALQTAIRKADVSPHTDMIADRVRSLQGRVVTGELNVDAPDFEEICVNELCAKPPRATSPTGNGRKGGKGRQKPTINPPQSVKELQDICVAFLKTCAKEVREANPLLVAFAHTVASTPVDDVFRPLITKFLGACPPEVREASAISISIIADAALELVSEEFHCSAAFPEPATEPTEPLPGEDAPPTVSAEPMPDSEPSPEQRPIFYKFGEPQSVEITGKPDLYALTGSRRTDIGDDDDDNLTLVSAERKPPAGESSDKEFEDSLAVAS